MNKKKIIRLLIFILVVAVIIAAIYSVNKYKTNKENMEQFDLNISTHEVGTGDIGIYVSAAGTITTGEDAIVLSNTKGEIDSINVSIGDYVQAGDVLSIVDNEVLVDEIADKFNEISAKKAAIDSDPTRYEINYIKSPIEGRIKQVNVKYVDPDDVQNDSDDLEWDDVEYEYVQDIMDEYGYLVKIAVGDSMYIVTDENISQYEIDMKVKVILHEYKDIIYKDAYVDKIEDGKAYIMIPSNYWHEGTDASIYNKDGKAIGSGISQYTDIYYLEAERGKIIMTSASINEELTIGETIFQVYDSSPQVIRDMYKELAVLEDELAYLQTQLENIEIISPVAGYIKEINLVENSQTESKETAFLIADNSYWKAIIQVDELDINIIEIGMQASITLDALVGNTYEGKVSNISSVGISSNGVTLYDVTIDISSQDDFRLSMNASADILILNKSDIVNVPIEAVMNNGSETYVMVYANRDDSQLEVLKADIIARQEQEQKQKDLKTSGNIIIEDINTLDDNISVGKELYGTKVIVETGIQNETNIEIINGLSKGDVVILSANEINDKTNSGGLFSIGGGGRGR